MVYPYRRRDTAAKLQLNGTSGGVCTRQWPVHDDGRLVADLDGSVGTNPLDVLCGESGILRLQNWRAHPFNTRAPGNSGLPVVGRGRRF